MNFFRGPSSADRFHCETRGCEIGIRRLSWRTQLSAFSDFCHFRAAVVIQTQLPAKLFVRLAAFYASEGEDG